MFSSYKMLIILLTIPNTIAKQGITLAIVPSISPIGVSVGIYSYTKETRKAVIFTIMEIDWLNKKLKAIFDYR